MAEEKINKRLKLKEENAAAKPVRRKPAAADPNLPKRKRGRPKKTDTPTLKVPTMESVKDFARREAQDSIIARALKQKERQPGGPKVSVDQIAVPADYHTTWVTLMVRDPRWIYAAWEMAAHDLNSAREFLKDVNFEARPALRLYDITAVEFDGTNANSFFDLEVGAAANWHVNLWSDDVSYCAEIGLKSPDGQFVALSRSNAVHTPRATTSWRTEQIWLEVKNDRQENPYVETQLIDLSQSESQTIPSIRHTPRRSHRRIYLNWNDIRKYYERLMPRLRDLLAAKLNKFYGRQLRRYQLIGESIWDRKRLYSIMPWQKVRTIMLGASDMMVLVEEGFNAKTRDSAGAFAGASEAWSGSSIRQLRMKQRKFFFELGAEIILYGRTEPDAQVWMNDRQIPLKSDGTFGMRFALPDGHFPFEFNAVPADKLERRKISTFVTRSTNEHQENYE